MGDPPPRTDESISLGNYFPSLMSEAKDESKAKVHTGQKRYKPYRLDICELLNRKSSRIVRVASDSELAHEFQIVLPPKKSKLTIIRARSIRVYTVPCMAAKY